MGEKLKDEKLIDANSAKAFEILTNRSAEELASLEDLANIGIDRSAQVEDIKLNTKKSQAKIFYASELLIGNRASDVDYFLTTINDIANGSHEDKPDAVVLSGLVQGDFKFRQKSQRSTLRPELQDMDKQFAFAKQALDHAASIGVPVVYSLSSEDRQVAEAYTDVVFRRMQKQAASHDSDDDSMSVSSHDKLRAHPEWITHYRFQTDVVYPYCLRAGRRLKTGQELYDMTNGAVDVDEYLLLWESHKRAVAGKKPRKNAQAVIDFDNLKNTKQLTIVDDFNHIIKTRKKQYHDKIRHSMGLTATSKSNNHLDKAQAWRGLDAANGNDNYDNLIIMHEQEAVGVVHPEGAGIHSIGGMINPESHIDEKGSVSNAYGNSVHRLRTTRKRAHSPSATSIERFDDGRQRVTIHNKKLREKSESIPNRTAIAKFCDWQTGSITARPDYQAKFADMVFHNIAKEHDVLIMGGDDFLHGRNYPDFPNESQSTGLMSMDSQTVFIRELLDNSLRDIDPDVLKRMKVSATIGNHEWNSGTKKWHGYSFIDYFVDAFQQAYVANGFTPEEAKERVKMSDTLITDKGEALKTYSAIEYVGDIGIESRHFSMERGGKGSGGNLPVYQTNDQAVGLGAAKQSIDVNINGHWHHPQYALFGDKLAIVNGSLAGLSGYEYERGYRPVVSGMILYVGGDKPPEIEFILEDALINHKIASGPYSDKEIRQEEGFSDDRNFDPYRHGVMLPEVFAKSALQKKLRKDMRAASESAGRFAELTTRIRAGL